MLLLLNTCLFARRHMEKVFFQLGRWREERRPTDLVIGVGGRVASQEGDLILRRALCRPRVWASDYHRLPAMLSSLRRSALRK